MAFKDFDASIDTLIATCKSLHVRKQEIFLPESLTYTLAEDIIAHENSPAFLTSSMDGYAICFSEQEKGELYIQDRVPAGTFNEAQLQKGSCIKTFTGSLMSKGSDTLIPIENVEVIGDKIKIITPVPKGFAIREIGENYKEGEVLIKKGTQIGYAQIGVMAELGIMQVPVSQKPKVAVLATGSEILELGEEKTTPAQIRSSNHVTIEGIIKEAGGEVERLPIVKDEKELIKKAILEALEKNDMIVTTGGVSVGDYDFVKEIISDIDPEYIVNGAAVKPGRHIRIVKVGEKFICALPGFPYSSAVMAYLYVLPLIKAMLGQEAKHKYVKAILQEDYKKRSPFTEFTACNLYAKEGNLCADLVGKRMGSSAILTNMLGDTALLRIEKDVQEIKKGECVLTLPMQRII